MKYVKVPLKDYLKVVTDSNYFHYINMCKDIIYEPPFTEEDYEKVYGKIETTEEDITYEIFEEDETKVFNMASCMLSILDSLKLFDQDSLDTSDETLSEIMFRKMKAYNIDLNKELGFTHLKPVLKNK